MNLHEESQEFDWISIGGGAAGFFGALQFAHALREKGKGGRVLILEKTAHPLAKVKISGGGRCNLTHHQFDPRELTKFYPRGSKELLSVFHRFSPRDTLAWFNQCGVQLKTESDGRVFPTSDRSQTVVELFQSECERLGVEVRVHAGVAELWSDSAGIRLGLLDGSQILGRHVMVATGSNRAMWEVLKTCGHKIVSPVPSLFSFNIDDPRLKGLAGRSFEKVQLRIPGKDKRSVAEGPLLITHWGLSGPAVLKLSSWEARGLSGCSYRFPLEINFFPHLNPEEGLNWMKRQKEDYATRKLKNASPPFLPLQYWQRLLEILHVASDTKWGELPKRHLHDLHAQLFFARFEISGKTTNKEEFVTAGGVDLKEVDFRSMESKLVKHLYFAGEVLDIDGLTGGFNFQNAWSTSYVAAKAAFQEMFELDTQQSGQGRP